MDDTPRRHKSIHVNLTKETHFVLRTLMFKHNISMQDVFGECANQIVNGTKIGQTIVENVVNRKLMETLENSSMKSKAKNKKLNDLDEDTLYSMINSGKNI